MIFGKVCRCSAAGFGRPCADTSRWRASGVLEVSWAASFLGSRCKVLVTEHCGYANPAVIALTDEQKLSSTASSPGGCSSKS